MDMKLNKSKEGFFLKIHEWNYPLLKLMYTATFANRLNQDFLDIFGVGLSMMALSTRHGLVYYCSIMYR